MPLPIGQLAVGFFLPPLLLSLRDCTAWPRVDTRRLEEGAGRSREGGWLGGWWQATHTDRGKMIDFIALRFGRVASSCRCRCHRTLPSDRSLRLGFDPIHDNEHASNVPDNWQLAAQLKRVHKAIFDFLSTWYIFASHFSVSFCCRRYCEKYLTDCCQFSRDT